MPEQTGQSLAAWLHWQEQSHPKSWDLGLARIGQVWDTMNCGAIADHVVIVAGTNGKGSCVRWCEALAVAHGISVATFTSPHLHDYRERIRFDGEYVNEKELIQAFETINRARGEITLTYFEWAALAAFYLMAHRKPQLAVLEVGLGGRLDATNLIDADAAIMTRIGLDHQDWLGQDIETIAREKAGVMRAGQTVALADAHPPQSVIEHARELGVVLWHQGDELQTTEEDEALRFSVPGYSGVLPLPVYMPGNHQYGHLAACIAVLGQWFSLSLSRIEQVVLETRHYGRLMWQKHPTHQADWLLDVAHNQDSAEVLRDFIMQHRSCYHRVWCLCGMLRDKDHDAVFTLLGEVVDQWVLCTLEGSRGFPATNLGKAAQDTGIDVTRIVVEPSVADGLAAVCARAQMEDLVVVMGSFVTVAEVLERLKEDE